MTWLKAFHGLNLALLALYGLPLGSVYSLYWGAWFLYALLFGGLLANDFVCARLLLFPPVGVVCTTGPIVGYNFYAFFFRHPLYVDSPATIIVVAILALFTTVPSLCLLACYRFLRREVFMGVNPQSQ